jgi:hypothetical protein
MVVVAPTVASIGATAWALSHPSQTTREGLVVAEQPLWHAVLNGVLGGVVVLLALIGLIFVCFWAWYRLLGGDAVWEAIYSSSEEGVIFVQLSCKSGLTADPVRLEVVECLLKKPSKKIVEYPGPLIRRHNPQGWVARFQTEPEPGHYEVRWFAQREGQHFREIARKKFSIPSATLEDDAPQPQAHNESDPAIPA